MPALQYIEESGGERMLACESDCVTSVCLLLEIQVKVAQIESLLILGSC